MSVWITRGSPKQTVTLRISLDGIYNVKWDVTGPALEALGQQISHPLLRMTQTESKQRRHGTAWDSDQYLWHKSFYLMTPSLSWHNVTQCVTLSRMLSRGGEWVRISLIHCMIVEGHIQNRSHNCITISTLRHLHDLNISHISLNMSQQVSTFNFAEHYGIYHLSTVMKWWCLCLRKIYSGSETVLSIRCLPTGIMTWN